MGLRTWFKPWWKPTIDCEKHGKGNDTFKRGGGNAECWSCYIDEFVNRNDTLETVENRVQKKYPKAKLYYFCDPDNYVHGKITGIEREFNKQLCNNNIGWFTYVSFYYNTNRKIKPLVAGKSGTDKVKAGYPDIGFSYSYKNKSNRITQPARYFLSMKKGRDWCKDKILVIPANCEGEAFGIETWLMEEFSLFGC